MEYAWPALELKMILVMEKFYETPYVHSSVMYKNLTWLFAVKNRLFPPVPHPSEENRLRTQSQLIPSCQTFAHFWCFVWGHADAKFRHANCPARALSEWFQFPVLMKKLLCEEWEPMCWKCSPNWGAHGERRLAACHLWSHWLFALMLLSPDPGVISLPLYIQHRQLFLFSYWV